MALLGRFGEWLTTSSSSGPKKGHPDLHPIEVPKLAKELNLAAEAKRLGEVGLPAPDATSLCGPEAAIVQRVERARQDYVDWAVLRLNILSRDLSRRNVTADVNRARQADQEFERKASALLSEHESVLRRLGDVVRARSKELSAYRVKHKLDRDADYPTSAGKYFRFGLLLVLILLEAGFNASFFATGLDTGLLGGLFEAALAATANVVLAFLYGKYLLPYIFHSNLVWRTCGLLGLVLAITVIVTIGLGISHYRDALTSEVSNAASVAQHTLLSAPFGLKPGSSWALFGISVVFAVIALLDGLTSDDRYPGYGSISRRTQEAVDDYEDELADLRGALEQLKNDELKSLDKVLEHAQASVAAFEATMRDKSSAGSRLQTAIRDADNSLEALLKTFRTENEIHRTSWPRPAYFDTYPQLRSLELPSFDTSADDGALAEQRELVKALLADAQAIRGRIQAAFNKQFDRLNPLDAHFLSEGQS
jgi:hypothetical protein